MKNRIAQTQADYVFLIVRKPAGWKPTDVHDVPHEGDVVSRHYVASYAEAHDDLVRCNQLALERNLDQWGVIQAPHAAL